MTPEERELAIEQVVSAHRERSGRGEVRAAPAWHDLDAEGRRDAFDAAIVARQLEAAADPDSLSATARAVLARIGRSP
ncbi:MAG: hypothetical protein R3F59_25290 [Myxococcota bacterium]